MTTPPAIDIEALYNLASLGAQPGSYVGRSPDPIRLNMSTHNSSGAAPCKPENPPSTPESDDSTHPVVQSDKDTEKYGILAGEDEARSGSEKEGEVRTTLDLESMRWWNVGILMIAETISLGILSLPRAVAKLGFFPGILTLTLFGLLATYAGYVIGQYKLRHPSIMNMADAGETLFSAFGSPRWRNSGRRLFGLGSTLFLIFCMAAHVLTFSVMMNVVTGDSGKRVCTVVYMGAGAAICFVLTLPRKLENISWISIPSLISIVAAVFITMIGVGIKSQGREAPDVEAVVEKVTFQVTMTSLMNIVMAYSGNVAFFGFMSEMREPKDYPKALFLLQGFAIVLYAIVASVIYYFVGASVSSPALTAAGPLIRNIAYYVALPTIIVAGVINASIASKYLLKLFKPQLERESSKRAMAWWTALCALVWLCAWILSESIPVFQDLLSLVSALLGSWFTYGISGGLGLHLNRGKYTESWRKMALTAVNVGMLLLGGTLSVLGTYASLYEIVKNAKGNVWACSDNSVL